MNNWPCCYLFCSITISMILQVHGVHDCWLSTTTTTAMVMFSTWSGLIRAVDIVIIYIIYMASDIIYTVSRVPAGLYMNLYNTYREGWARWLGKKYMILYRTSAGILDAAYNIIVDSTCHHDEELSFLWQHLQDQCLNSQLIRILFHHQIQRTLEWTHQNCGHDTITMIYIYHIQH